MERTPKRKPAHFSRSADKEGMTENLDPKDPEAGLVIYDKTDRSGLFEHTFPTPEEIETASHAFPEIQEAETKNEPSRHYVSLSPASVKVSKRSTLDYQKPANYQPRKAITEWSRKSRSNMVAVLCSLDYLPMFENGGIPALITLTYPKNFRTLCPSAKVATRHLKLFRQRYERAFGKIRAIYKWEFMRSGSPHAHIFLVPPKSPDFHRWLSTTWAEIVAEPDPEEYAKHLKAGTAVDFGKGLRSTDPKRLAVYFSKHSSPNKEGDKEYQNKVPDFWKAEGSVGRFWGRWGLSVAVATVEVSAEQALFVSRTLRRWARANVKARKVVVWRTNTKTGELRKRRVNRRPKRMKRREGFCAVNDGSVMGKQLASAITARFVSSGE